MAPVLATARRELGMLHEDWRAYTWRSPDWWLGAASVGAWMALTWMFLELHAGTPHGMHPGHAAAMSYAAMLAAWALMVVALMLPLLRKQARWVALRSLRRRRQQATCVVVVAYLVVWLVAGTLAITLLAPVRGSWLAVAVALAVAAGWQCAPARRRLLRRCVQRAPAVHGVRAVADWSRGGLLAGRRCVATCGALMLPMAIVHSPVLIVGAAIVVASERRRGPNPDTRGGRRLEASWIAAGALLAAVFAGAA